MPRPEAPHRTRAPEWRRLRPGEDPIVDAFLAAQLELVERRLMAARDWHPVPRDYRLDPDPRRRGAAALYDIETVNLVAVPRRSLPPLMAGAAGVLAVVLAYALLGWQVVALLR